jgi:hypothetical protein
LGFRDKDEATWAELDREHGALVEARRSWFVRLPVPGRQRRNGDRTAGLHRPRRP